LASVAPGPGLASALMSIDRAAVGADAMLDVVAARARLLWHVQGELLADLARVVEATLAAEPARPDSDEDVDRVVAAVGELVGWTLHWTRRYAQGQVMAAVALQRRLPMVLAAVREGQICQAKAEAFADALACVNDETAARIATRLLPKARRWTLTELRSSLRYHVDKADPKAARRRYRRTVAGRDVWLQADPDGTATVSAQGLAPHRAAAAYDRIDRIARAARASGDVRTLAQLRADAFCDVLAGIPFQLIPGTDPITAQADAAACHHPDLVRSVPDWPTESRFPNTKTSDADGGQRPEPPVPPEDEPTGVIDLYDYDRACVTDEDRAWADIGFEPPGAADDETPDWWHLCHPTRPTPPQAQPTPPEGQPGATGGYATPTAGSESRFENRNPVPGPEDHLAASGPGTVGAQPTPTGERVTVAAGAESHFENRNPAPDPKDQAAAAGPAPVGAQPPPTGGRVTVAAGAESRSENGISAPDPKDLVEAGGPGPVGAGRPTSIGVQPTPAAGQATRVESRFENGIAGGDREDRVWAAAQADALFDRAVLSWDILPGDRCGCGGRLTVRPGVVDVQVKLTTLAGLDDDPALIPGLGVTLAAIARQVAFDPHTRPTWRWSIFDSHGHLLHHGLTRARPTAPQSRSHNEKTQPPTGWPAGSDPLLQNGKPDLNPTGDQAVRPCTCVRIDPGRRRGVVELQLTPTTLHQLLADPGRVPGWQPVLADIAAQVDQDRRLNPPGKWDQTDQHGNLRHHGHTQRMPDAVEEAFIRARDRSCRAPHCHVPASRCELDHRIEYAKGGPSHRGCVDLRCKRHHHLRDHTTIRITRTGGTVTWTIPSGRTFTVTTDKDLILTRDD